MLVLCDVAKSSEVKEMVRKVTDRFGGIDILVNNAALTDHANIFDSTEEEFDKVIEVSLKGPYLVTKYVVQQMRDQGRGGKIVNFGSTSGMVGRFDGIAYRDGDAFLFGSETAGLPQAVLDAIPEPQRLRLPMRPGNRSLNLSNTVAVMVFEAWRQLGFDGGA